VHKLSLSLAVALSAVTLCSPALAKDYYVSANRGRGKKATKKKPAKDLGNIISKLQPGDTVHIAEGTYLGRGENGSNTIDVPVSIIGGYSDDFSKRDPWGAHKTILSGNNLTQNYTPQPALKIDLMKSHFKNIQGCEFVIDGLIIDHGARNRYQTDKQAKLLLKADPKTGKNPSPSLGGLVIWLNKSGKFDEGPPWKVTVQNCIILNTHQNQGALAVSGFRQSTITIRNNAVINHSGTGIFLGSKFHGAKDKLPKFVVENNTVLFSADSGMSQGFSLFMDTDLEATIKNNVFAFSDIYALNNGKKTKNVLLMNNLVAGARKADYVEGDMKMDIEEMIDEAELVHEDSDGNFSKKIKIPVSAEWAKVYGSRVVVDREKAEAGIKAKNSDANSLRSMLGLPLDAGSVKWPKIDVYLPRISVEDGVKAASTQYEGKGSGKALIK
tara:strand:- start:655 stop:1977 length:1323 start_codon:yes stop_codon:yes gene_type:complete